MSTVLVLLLIFFYVIFGNGSLSGTVVAIIVFALNSAAFFFEGMRAGINSIDPGQMEAAQPLGFSDNQAFFRFVFPQAARHFFPVYGGELISLLKGTSE